MKSRSTFLELGALCYARSFMWALTFWASAGALLATCGGSTVCTNISDFSTCVSATGSGSTCQMASGVWGVNSTILIGRNVAITGTPNSTSDVILQRTSALGSNAIMGLSAGGLSPTIKWITFDGNRNGIASLTCAANWNNPVADLMLENAGAATVQYADFISAPYYSLFLGTSSSGGASTVSYSNFGQGFSAHGISRTAQQTASRNSAIVFFSGSGTGAWFNNIAYSGEGGIYEYGGAGGGGTLQYIIGNSINSTRYEEPDGIPGGQLYIQGGVTYTSVADNIINGNYWITSKAQQGNPNEPYYTLCAPGTNSDFPYGAFPYGIEASATGDRYFNNAIIQNLGFGILLRPWNDGDTLDSVEISGYDPFCPEYCTYSAQYIENNTGCSVVANCFMTPTWPVSMGVAGINVNNTAANETGTGHVTNLILDHVRSTSNNKFGISMDHVSGIGYEDTSHSPPTSYPYACIESNGTNVNTGTSGNSLTNPNYTNVCP